ncbi:MAG TPA: ABC transporter permease [Candidatus Angelobacter sp.]|nr:ABC transporter permease [Candidatus Angelobacter sp.]
MGWKLWFSGTALAAIHIVVLSARFLAPYDPAEQNRELAFTPPTRLHWVDAAGHFHLRPFVYGSVNVPGDGGAEHYSEDRSRVCPVRFFVRADDTKAGALRLFGVDDPGRIFLLGTDDFGRDQFSRLLYGGQISLLAGLFATALTLGVGLLLGGVAGYFGSWVDEVIMRAAEIFMALPWIYLLFAVRAFLPLRLDARGTFLLLIGVVGLTGWARPSRLIRGIVLSAKQRDYVRAARGFGASPAYILWRHVLPETWGVVLTQAALLVPQYILAEVALSFLGLGVGEPAASWGNMLASLQRYYVLSSYSWMFASGLVLVPVFLLYYSLADALQTRLRKAELR